MDMFSDPMEEVILEVLLDLQVHHPAGALEFDLIESPLEPHSKGGDLLVTLLVDLIEDLHKNIK